MNFAYLCHFRVPIMSPHRVLTLSLPFALLLAGCAGMRTLGTARTDSSVEHHYPEDRTQQGHDQVRTAATALLEGIHLYDDGNYQEAITKLSGVELQTTPNAIRVEALKYTAFSYCVMERYAECRHAFDIALSIDSDFELLRSEGGHPMWGPVFEQAKAASEKDHARTLNRHESEQWRSNDAWRVR